MTYRGPYTLDEIEVTAGPFTEAVMRSVPNAKLGPGQTQLTTIGYRWPCGCETRGTGTPSDMPACVWAACGKHEHVRDEMPERPDRLGFEDPEPIIVSRRYATPAPGGIVVWPCKHENGEQVGDQDSVWKGGGSIDIRCVDCGAFLYREQYEDEDDDD